jgi:hypothetical protein
MSFSGNSLTTSDQSQLGQLEAQRTSILKRIAALENPDTVVIGHSKDTPAEELTKIKTGRLARFKSVLAKIETDILAARHTATTTITPLATESKKNNLSDEPASRDWYRQFETNHINPAIQRLTKTIIKGKEAWKPIDDSDVRKEFLHLAKQILTHYQERQLATQNLANYIEAIEIADIELARIRKTTLGYFNLRGVATSFSEAKAKKTEVILPGALGRALATFKQGNLPDAARKKIPLLTITSDAERDFTLMTNRFVKLFILDKNPNIQFDQRALRIVMGMDMVQEIFKIHETKFATRIHDYEADILLATPKEAPSPSSKNSDSQRVIQLDTQKSASSTPQQKPAVNSPKHAAKSSISNEPTTPVIIPEKTVTAPVSNAIVPETAAINFSKHGVPPSAAKTPTLVSKAATTPAVIISASKSDTTTNSTATIISKAVTTPAITNKIVAQPSAVISPPKSETITNNTATIISKPIITPAISNEIVARPSAVISATQNGTTTQSAVSIINKVVTPANTVLAISPRITRLSSATTTIAQPESQAHPVINPTAAIVPISAKQSFFQRHKKKILWGLGIGLIVGLTIATGGVFAVAFSGAVAATVAVVGATTLANTIGLGVGLAAAIGVLGAVGTATACAVSDYRHSRAEEPATAILDHPYMAITDAYDTGRIHRETGMPIATPRNNTAPAHQNAATPQNTATHSTTNDARHDDTIIEQPKTPRI